MLRSGRKGRSNTFFPLAWIWLVVGVVLTGTRGVKAATTNVLHQTAGECEQQLQTLKCTLSPGDERYDLDNFKWGNLTMVMIEANRNRVHLPTPRCSDKKRKVKITNASKVITEPSAENCSLQLELINCEGVTIEGSVDGLRMKSSQADKVMLQRVTKLNLESSYVKEISLVVDDTSSVAIIKDCWIKVVTKLEMQGSLFLDMKNTTLGRVKHIFCNSSGVLLNNVEVIDVSSQGFQVNRGNLTLSYCKIKRLAAMGIMVNSEARLKVQYSSMETTSQDTIIVNPYGKVSFTEVAIRQTPNVSFTLSDATMKLYPLAFLKIRPMPPIAWIAMGVVFGLAVGGGMAVFVMVYVRKWRTSTMIMMDTNELLGPEHSPCVSKIDSGSSSNSLALKNFPTPPKRPLPQVPNGVNEDYDEYTDVLNQSQNDLMTGVAQRPPLAPPKHNISIKDRALAKLTSRPLPTKRRDVILPVNTDDRDVLPPPPPPAAEEEETYDDVALTKSLGPLPPPAAMKPNRKPPPPPIRGKPPSRPI